MACIICEEDLDTRMGACFNCANFESLIYDKLDMRENPIEKTIPGSESLNILKAIHNHWFPKSMKDSNAN